MTLKKNSKNYESKSLVKPKTNTLYKTKKKSSKTNLTTLASTATQATICSLCPSHAPTTLSFLGSTVGTNVGISVATFINNYIPLTKQIQDISHLASEKIYELRTGNFNTSNFYKKFDSSKGEVKVYDFMSHIKNEPQITAYDEIAGALLVSAIIGYTAPKFLGSASNYLKKAYNTYSDQKNISLTEKL